VTLVICELLVFLEDTQPNSVMWRQLHEESSPRDVDLECPLAYWGRGGEDTMLLWVSQLLLQKKHLWKCVFSWSALSRLLEELRPMRGEKRICLLLLCALLELATTGCPNMAAPAEV